MNEEIRVPLGYVKYYGPAVDAGFMDAKKSADALAGFDEVLRYLLYKEDPSLRGIDFEFPVRVQKGSWEIEIPHNVASLVTLVGGTTVLVKYFSAIAEKAGADGVFETGPAKDFGKTVAFSMRAFRKIIEIAKYCGKLGQKSHDNVKLLEEDKVEIIKEGLPALVTSYHYYRLYAEAPATLLDRLGSVIAKGREMEIGVQEGRELAKTQVTLQEKPIFTQEKEVTANDIVLPELEDGQRVKLIGEVTRCTETANTIGFCYQGHVLTCKPESGSIIPFKSHIISKTDDHIFTPIEMSGVVVREAVDGHFKEKKPHIVFDSIVPVGPQNKIEKQGEFKTIQNPFYRKLKR